ncbi:MAG: ATP-binding protein [Victivallales bacterium]
MSNSHESIPRNPLIAEVCYKVGYIDSWGRGVEKITESCRESGLPPPQFTERSGGILVELRRAPVKLGNQLGNQLGDGLGEIPAEASGKRREKFLMPVGKTRP